MKLAICYSGRLGEALAKEMWRWLPRVLGGIDLFYAPRDITKGEKWQRELARALEQADGSLLCITGEGATRPWINWEASRSARVYALLFELDDAARAELESGPLGADQSTRFEREDVERLLRSMCASHKGLELNERRLARSWPALQRSVRRVLKARKAPFQDDLAGGWWEFVGSKSGPTAMSFVQITSHGAGPHLMGKGYDAKGKVASTWESTIVVCDPSVPRVVYAWKGQQGAEPRNGMGEFSFFRTRDGRIGEGHGHFHDTDERGYYATKESQFVRATSSEERTMLAGDAAARARAVRRRLGGRA